MAPGNWDAAAAAGSDVPFAGTGNWDAGSEVPFAGTGAAEQPRNSGKKAISGSRRLDAVLRCCGAAVGERHGALPFVWGPSTPTPTVRLLALCSGQVKGDPPHRQSEAEGILGDESASQARPRARTTPRRGARRAVATPARGQRIVRESVFRSTRALVPAPVLPPLRRTSMDRLPARPGLAAAWGGLRCGVVAPARVRRSRQQGVEL